ncbi:hypothetical protein ACJX0J_007025, partial [Zea mays]
RYWILKRTNKNIVRSAHILKQNYYTPISLEEEYPKFLIIVDVVEFFLLLTKYCNIFETSKLIQTSIIAIQNLLRMIFVLLDLHGL